MTVRFQTWATRKWHSLKGDNEETGSAWYPVVCLVCTAEFNILVERGNKKIKGQTHGSFSVLFLEYSMGFFIVLSKLFLL